MFSLFSFLIFFTTRVFETPWCTQRPPQCSCFCALRVSCWRWCVGNFKALRTDAQVMARKTLPLTLVLGVRCGTKHLLWNQFLFLVFMREFSNDNHEPKTERYAGINHLQLFWGLLTWSCSMLDFTGSWSRWETSSGHNYSMTSAGDCSQRLQHFWIWDVSCAVLEY